MKLNAYLLVLSAAATLVSCSPMDEGRGVELTFDTDTAEYTRGVVTGASLYDNVSGNRPLYVSAYMLKDNQPAGNYFVGHTFTKSLSTWRGSPSVWWPVGTTLNFLSYSSNTPFSSSDVLWGVPDASERLRLRVGGDRTQDDILVGSAWNQNSVDDGGNADMTMHHTQAWITVRFSLSGSADPALPVSVGFVKLRDIYTGGVLDVENNYGHPEQRMFWDFRDEVAVDKEVDDVYGAYGLTLTTAPRTVEMLIPEQERTALILSYTVNGVAVTATKELSGGHWAAGKHYIYDIVFDPVDHTPPAPAPMYPPVSEMETDF